MKQAYLILLLFFMANTLFAQSPDAFNYQAVLRDMKGTVIANQEVGIQISIIEGDSLNISTYIETFQSTTNQFGLINIQIGNGETVAGNFNDIRWGQNRQFIKIEVDADGGNNYLEIGVSELLSVPYALYAKSVENDKVNDADSDPENEIQTLSLNGNELSISKGNTITLPTGTTGSDNNSSDEIQDISLSGSELTITQGSTVDLSVLQDGTGTDNQKLYLSENNELRISKGNTITLPYIITEQDGDASNELQMLSISNDTIYLSDGGFVKLPASIGFNGSFNDLSDIPVNLDTDSTNDFNGEYSSLSNAPTNLSSFINDVGYLTQDTTLDETEVDAMVANNGYITNEVDGSVTNELQALSISNDTLILSNGGFVKLPAETDPVFTAWDKSSGIAITQNQITDLSPTILPRVFEKELANGENNIDIGFELETTSLVFFNGSVLPANAWSGAGTQILNLNINTNQYDNIKVKK